jgi:hypothetical protein
MDDAAFHSFSRELAARLALRPEVLGLVFVGSAAAVARAPDAWSDHDFFVFVEDAAAERYRRDLSWLPPAPRLLVAHRETQHGLKLLLEGGHVCELAIFTAADRIHARGDTWRVAFDRGLALEPTMQAQVERTTPRPDPAWSSLQMLFALLIGAGRHRRGEHLAAHRAVFGDALPQLVALLARDRAGDPFDPLRRFESLHPQLGAAISATLRMPADEAALALLALAEEHLQNTPARLPAEAIAAVRGRLG